VARVDASQLGRAGDEPAPPPGRGGRSSVGRLSAEARRRRGVVRGLGACGLVVGVAGIWGPIPGAFFAGGWALLVAADRWLARRRVRDIFRRAGTGSE
jgi:hypothetical protein